MAENSTDDNSNLVDMDDLKSFEDQFFNRQKPEEVEVEVEGSPEAEVDETEDDPLATEEDEVEAEVEDQEGESEDEPKPEPEQKAKKKSGLQTRIDELVAEAREAQRERDAEKTRRLAIEERLAKVEAREEPDTVQVVKAPEAPQPDAVNDKGEPVYPLGEFDPRYITDLARFTVKQEADRLKAEQAEQDRNDRIARAQADIRNKYAERVKEVESELPDFREKVISLTSAFEGVDPKYGDYLASTIMQCDNGPEIMYYLSQNIGEAREIVASGPFAATLAIGRLQARLEKPVEKEQKSDTKKVSEAPAPPVTRSRGSRGQYTVAPDTNDLEAFQREFYKK